MAGQKTDRFEVLDAEAIENGPDRRMRMGNRYLALPLHICIERSAESHIQHEGVSAKMQRLYGLSVRLLEICAQKRRKQSCAVGRKQKSATGLRTRNISQAHANCRSRRK